MFNEFYGPRNEPDETVPYWDSFVEVSELLAAYAAQPENFDIDEILTLAPSEMRGTFRLLISNDRTHPCSFTPGDGDDLALTFPVIDRDKMVDLVAVSIDEPLAWGCVTGRGQTIGPLATSGPIRVYRTAYQWLRFGCDGVLVLAKQAYPRLTKFDFRTPNRPLLIAENLDHADELVERVFMDKLYEDQLLHAEPIFFEGALRLYESESANCVAIDDERCDVASELKWRVRYSRWPKKKAV